MIDYNINLNSNLFEEVIRTLLDNNEIEEIIETGTFNGLGSTTIFAKTGKKVFSIESCLGNFFTAKENLKQYNNIELIYGSSLPFDEMISFIKNDDFYLRDEVKNKSVIIDGPSADETKSFYETEVLGWDFGKPSLENALIDLIDNNKKQIVFLDSAGGVGYLEFKVFMSLTEDKRKNKILLLDDVFHIKHFRSVEELKNLGYPVVVSNDNRFAYCIFK